MKSIRLTRLALLVLLFSTSSTWWGCKKSSLDDSTPVVPVNEAHLPQQWMDLSYNTVKRQGMFALDASRLYAYTAITAYESMVHGLPNGRSLAGQLQGLDELPQPEAGKTYDWGIVLCHAVPQMMHSIVPDMTLAADFYLDKLAREQEDELVETRSLSQSVVDDSKEYANALVTKLIEWSKTDNRIGLESLNYATPPYQPQHWKGSTLGQTFMMPYWWTSRPFAIPTYRQCEPDAPHPYSTDPSSQYYLDVKEVYEASFDPAKVEIGRYWANNPGQSGSPAGSWLAIANQLVDQYDLDLPTTLQMYVLLSIGTRDGFIACWYMKYKYNLQRPVTYIRDVMGHTDWTSPVPTPPYPDYTSGTSTNAGVSSEILTRMFGFRSFSDAQHEDKGFGVRAFANFKDAGVEAFHSRIYGGVHMRRACEKGFEQGECIGEYLYNNLKFNR